MLKSIGIQSRESVESVLKCRQISHQLAPSYLRIAPFQIIFRFSRREIIYDAKIPVLLYVSGTEAHQI